MYYEMRADGTRIPRHGGGIAKRTILLDDDATLSVADSGSVIEMGTDAKTITLPKAVKGLIYTFRNIGADGNNTLAISPNAADAIFGTVSNAAADSVSGGAIDKDIVNTKATANKGDYLILEADDSETGYYISGGVGIWASEA